MTAPTSQPPPAKPATPAPGTPLKRDTPLDERGKDIVENALLRSAGTDPRALAKAAHYISCYRLMTNGAIAGGGWGEKGEPISQIHAGRLILFCAQNDLDPTVDVAIIGGRPYVKLEGRLKMAFRTTKFDGFSCDRPMTEEERKTYRIKDDEDAWITAANRSDCKFPFIGVGKAAAGRDRNPVAREFPLDMAMKRAREGALNQLAPADISDIEVGRVLEVPATRQHTGPVEERRSLPASTGALTLEDAGYGSSRETREPVPVESRRAAPEIRRAASAEAEGGGGAAGFALADDGATEEREPGSEG